MVANSNASENSNNGFLVLTLAAGTATMSIDNSVVANNGVNGIRAEGSANAVARISRNTVTSNGTGLSTATGGQIVSYRNNNVSGNTVDGAPTSSLPAPGTI
jgi:hypothetical protein